MCGIAGAVGAIDPELAQAVRRMMDAQVHRGPDDSGEYVSIDRGPGVVLGFRRLSILDLSPSGHQPMRDSDRGNVVVFNGEIYNFAELRAELGALGETFRSQTDTEALLRAYGKWGNAAVSKLRGMFGFALYDPERRSVLLARDRLGIKPLYYATIQRAQGKAVLFASELRALLATGLISRHLEPAGLSSYLWNGFVVGPHTMVRGISLLAPGCTLELRVDAPEPRPKRYWSLGPRAAGDSKEAIDELENELLLATRQHLVSDVPLGVFLSGGVDSSAIASLAVRAGSRRVQTFHIGFDEAGFDESRYAREVAEALGTEHVEFRLTQQHFRANLEASLNSLDQPTFDAINTYFVSRVVREAGFTVALAGTGGDELFGGYPTFRELPPGSATARGLSVLPRSALKRATKLALWLKHRGVANAQNSEVPPQTRWAKLADLLATGGDLLAAYQVSYGLYTQEFLAELAPRETLALTPNGLSKECSEELRRATVSTSAVSSVSTFELAMFIGERLLRDSDAASMASSLELRVPLLDHRVVEASQQVPERARFRPLGKKNLLKSLAMPSMDPKIFDRPKAGFVLPIEVWAKDQLAEKIGEIFSDGDLVRGVGLRPEPLNALWRSFRAGAPGLYWSRVWSPFVLLDWCRTHDVRLP